MKILLSSLLALFIVGSASAATVSVSVSTMGAGSKMFAVESGLSLLTVGSAVRVGYFDGTLGSMAAVSTSNDYNELNNMFRPLGEGRANAGDLSQIGAGTTNMIVNDPTNSLLPATGTVFGQFTNVQETYIANAMDLYMWVFNHSDPTQATQWGIFSAATGWEFPAGNGGVVLNTNEILSTGDIMRGSMSGNQLRLSTVPEPSSLILIIALGAFLRRRLR